jgi:type IV secretory pathway VirD2 relaxase
MESDLGTKLDWIAVDHTGHPHIHILVRGVTEDRKTLNTAGDYIAFGIREQASEIATRATTAVSHHSPRQRNGRSASGARPPSLRVKHRASPDPAG